MIKTIQTEYKGYLFRSRLEARWAVFFDAIGAEWEYEPEGFCENGVYYLPDFRVKCWGYREPFSIEEESSDLYIEVKNDTGKISKAECDKIATFSHYKPILIVTGIPEPNDWIGWITDRWDNPICSSSKGEGLCPYNFQTIDGDYYAAYPCISDDGEFFLAGADSNYLWWADMARTASAYKAARQARFEHGETPCLNK